ncbi:Hpt domain-containing protein, partial [Rhizobiaceae sp. 2RAB30]
MLAIERQESDSETINAVFRAVHSIKGGAGAFGLDELVRFAHTFETTLDLMRSNALEIDGGLVKLMLRSADGLADLVRFSRDGTDLDRARIAQLNGELARAASGDAAPAQIETAAPEATAEQESGPDENGFTPI